MTNDQADHRSAAVPVTNAADSPHPAFGHPLPRGEGSSYGDAALSVAVKNVCTCDSASGRCQMQL